MWRVLWWVSYLYTAKKTCLGAQLELKMKTMERIFEIKDLKALEDFLQSQTETRSFFVRLLTTIS